MPNTTQLVVTVNPAKGRKIGVSFDELNGGRGLKVRTVNPTGLAFENGGGRATGMQLVSIAGGTEDNPKVFDCSDAPKKALQRWVEELFVPGRPLTLTFDVYVGDQMMLAPDLASYCNVRIVVSHLAIMSRCFPLRCNPPSVAIAPGNVPGSMLDTP